MRDTSSLDPMWNPEGDARGGRIVRLAGRVLGTVAPHLLRWAAGMEPELRVAWGASEYHLRRDGVVTVRREGDGYGDNPRTNYNERIRKRQERAANEASAADAGPSEAEEAVDSEAPAPETADVVDAVDEPEAGDPGASGSPVPTEPAEEPKLDLSEAALRSAVAESMGGGAAGEPIKDGDQLKEVLGRVRASLEALDDVKDWDTIETFDDELYKLHRAVEYTMRNHKASEAKAKLDNLFK